MPMLMCSYLRNTVVYMQTSWFQAISRSVAALPPEKMFELMKQMKDVLRTNPNEAKQMLYQNPQLAYALLQVTFSSFHHFNLSGTSCHANRGSAGRDRDAPSRDTHPGYSLPSCSSTAIPDTSWTLAAAAVRNAASDGRHAEQDGRTAADGHGATGRRVPTK